MIFRLKIGYLFLYNETEKWHLKINKRNVNALQETTPIQAYLLTYDSSVIGTEWHKQKEQNNISLKLKDRISKYEIKMTGMDQQEVAIIINSE